MRQEEFSRPLSLKEIKVTDAFWKKEMELVRKEVIPYQWDALNDRVEGAAPSYCMHNFRAAGKLNRERREAGENFREPVYTYRGFEMLPEDPAHPEEDQFYGFVFQDNDFYKWIEAVAYSLAQHPDPQLERTADEAIDLVCAAQQEDGYLDTYYILNGKDKIFTNLRDHHELYCMGHLLEGATAYYQATGKDKLLRAACRFADFAAEYFGEEEGKCKGYPGHEIAEMGLVRLYEATGDEKYLKLGRYFVDQRGKRPYYFDGEHPGDIRNQPEDMRYEYHQAHLPVREQDEAVGHAVRAVYLYSGMADVARLTGDESLHAACETLWNSVVNKKLYITGGIGGTHIGEAFSFAYDLPNDTAYAETCAAIGLVFWARRMLEIRPDSGYADVMERALYNCVLSGMALDGKSFFYVNPLEVVPQACRQDQRKSHVRPVRQKWFSCACCPPNLARIVSSVGAYAFTCREDTLFVHLYMGSEIVSHAGGREVRLCMESGFPWNGNVRIRLSAGKEPYTLALRIPGWCGSYEIKGAEDGRRETRDGYLYITKVWEEGECLELHFPMEIQFLQADSRVREDVGRVAVTRGPLTYCLEEADNGADLHMLTIDCGAKAGEETFTVAGEQVTAIRAEGYREEMPEKTGARAGCGGLYRPVSERRKAPVRLRLVPYYVWGNRGENEMTVWIRREG
ncbi:MAG: glycoside hydrolase family 127 protein [Lachnospiraceae bacterium]|nr:glycoside hydrolase family 127 protein [Lachnospiraceae bacterium]